MRAVICSCSLAMPFFVLRLLLDPAPGLRRIPRIGSNYRGAFRGEGGGGELRTSAKARESGFDSNRSVAIDQMSRQLS